MLPLQFCRRNVGRDNQGNAFLPYFGAFQTGRGMRGKTIAALGLTFKPEADNMRNAFLCLVVRPPLRLQR